MVSWLLLSQETRICSCATFEKSLSARLHLVAQHPAEIQSCCWACWLCRAEFQSCLLHLSLLLLFLLCHQLEQHLCVSLLLRAVFLSSCPTPPNKLGATALQSGYHGCVHAWPGAIRCYIRCKYLRENKLSSTTNEWKNKQATVAAASLLNLLNIWETEA